MLAFKSVIVGFVGTVEIVGTVKIVGSVEIVEIVRIEHQIQFCRLIDLAESRFH